MLCSTARLNSSLPTHPPAVDTERAFQHIQQHFWQKCAASVGVQVAVIEADGFFYEFTLAAAVVRTSTFL